jgi:hypothetical protein
MILVASSAALLVASGLVGVRLTWLSRRTGGLPERLMGLGLVTMFLVYIPMMAVSGMGRVSVGELRFGLLVFATLFLWSGAGCIVGFTWKTFRPGDTWAELLTLAICSGLAATGGGLVAALHVSPPEMRSFDAGQLWAGLIRLPLIATFVWTGLEGLRHHQMSRRRLALGLADPVVTNRFLLWGVLGLVQTAIQVVSLTLHVQGLGMLASPVGLFVVAVAGIVGSVFMYLTFMPPRFYVRMLEQRPPQRA